MKRFEEEDMIKPIPVKKAAEQFDPIDDDGNMNIYGGDRG